MVGSVGGWSQSGEQGEVKVVHRLVVRVDQL